MPVLQTFSNSAARAFKGSGGASGPTVTGGTAVVSGAYTIRTFTASDTLSITGGSITADILVIAGGGGGGNGGANYCGGGGAGGLLQPTSVVLTGILPIVIGGGGGLNSQGSNTTFSTYTAVGGGTGANSYYATGGAGGSGGGGGPTNGAGGARTVDQGNIGGVASSANAGGSDSGAGGGGGAGGAGYDRQSPGGFRNSPGGAGEGLQLSISGTATWYAAGGVGAGFYYGDRGNGIGGGTSGYNYPQFQNIQIDPTGSANTGSGGGGKGWAQGGGSGGSGVVIIKYLTPSAGGSAPAVLSPISSGLILNLDAAKSTSYSGSGTTWSDLSGNNYHGTLLNGPTYSAANGGSIVFDGVDDYVSGTLPTTAISNVTLQGWVNVQAGRKGPFFRLGSNGVGYSVGQGTTYYSNTGTEAIMLFSGIRWISTGVQWNTGWQMVTMILDGSGVPSVYKNTTFIGSYGGSNAGAPSGSYVLGRVIGDEPGGGGPWAGNLANFWVYNRILTTGEISQNFETFRSRFGV
jgi:hypothetical protein